MDINNIQEKSNKYLSVKSNIISTKLKSVYPNILIKNFPDEPEQLVIKFLNWTNSNTHIFIINGSRNEESAYIVYSSHSNLEYYGILSENLSTQIEQILTIINFINQK
jgi:hypothetical protein